MSDPYDAELRAIASSVARGARITLEEGTYSGWLGPSYETPAEIRMLARLGVDAVGMSTVPEVIVAKARGMRVLGFSAITNLAAGLGGEALTHEEVLGKGGTAVAQLTTLIEGILPRIGGV
jgi:purine-nucleoside phosphorylase